MALSALRRYDVQATYAVRCAVISLLPVLVATALAIRNYENELGQIVYGSKGIFLPLFLGCIAISTLIGSIGFVLGWNSSDRRRNDKPKQSWTGFFIGGSVLTLNAVLLLAFWMLRLQQPL